MKNFKSILASALVIILLMTSTLGNLTVYGQSVGNSTDIEGNWAEEEITDWVNRGLVEGYADGSFKPNDSISRAEFVAMINRIFGFREMATNQFKDVSNKWYHDEVLKAKAAGYISGYADETFKPEEEISRQEATKIIYQLMKFDKKDEMDHLKTFNDGASVPAWSRPYLNTIIGAGYIGGFPDQTVRPYQPITRAQAVVMLDRMMGTLINSPGTYGKDDEKSTINGNMTIGVEGVTVKNTVVKGDLYLAAGIGEGEVYLDNVTVEGRTIVSGGGENSIIILNSTINEMIIDKVVGKVRVVSSGDTTVVKVIIKTSVKLQEENPKVGFGDVEILAKNPQEQVNLSGEYKKIMIENSADVQVEENTKIEELQTQPTAEGATIHLHDTAQLTNVVLNGTTKINGNGTIFMAFINVEGTVIEAILKEYLTKKGIEFTPIIIPPTEEPITQPPTTPPTDSTGGTTEDPTTPPPTDSTGGTTEDPTTPVVDNGSIKTAVIINNKLYMVFDPSFTGDPILGWAIKDETTKELSPITFETINNDVYQYQLTGDLLNDQVYSIVQETLDTDPSSVVSSTPIKITTHTNVDTSQVYGHVSYTGTNNVEYDINRVYYVTDLSNQITLNATPLVEGDVINIFVNNQWIIKATFNQLGLWDYTVLRKITKPNAPLGVIAKPISNRELTVFWDAVVDADFYHVYYSDSATGEYIPVKDENGNIREFQRDEVNGFVDNINLPNTTRYYKVTATRDRLESDFSTITSATTYYNHHIKLDFNVTDTVEHPTLPIVYITDKVNQKLYAVNYETEEIQSVSLSLPPESITFNNGEIFISLLKGEHSPYWYEETQAGAIAIVDATTLTITNVFDINRDPYDIAVDRSGFIYIAGGSGQSTDFKVYQRSASTLTEVASSGISETSNIQLHPTIDRVYTITTTSSPRDMTAFTMSNGQFVEPTYPGGYDSPYHGDYPMNTNIKISPDGKYIFNGAGTVFLTAPTRYEDMRYVYTLNNSFTDIAFELANQQFYTIKDKKIGVYEYEYFQQKAQYNLDGIGKTLFNAPTKLLAISNFNGKYVMEVIEKNSIEQIPTTTPSGIMLTGTISDVVYDSTNHKAYAIDKAFRRLHVVNLDTKVIENTVALPYRPSRLNLSEDGTKIYIANDDEFNLVTEVSIGDYQILRHLSYTSPKDHGDYSHRHVYNRGGKIYVTLGNWNPTLLVFDATTFTKINYGMTIDSVGDMVFSNDNSKLFYWYQYGWNAGSAGSNVFAYSIVNNTISKISESNLGYPNMSRDPLNTPIFLLEERGLVIAKNKVLNMNNLIEVIATLPEEIYAVAHDGSVGVGKNGIYDLTTFTKTQTLNLSNAEKIFYDNNGQLFYLAGSTIFINQ